MRKIFILLTILGFYMNDVSAQCGVSFTAVQVSSNPVCETRDLTLSVDNYPGWTYTWTQTTPAGGTVGGNSSTITIPAPTLNTYTYTVTGVGGGNNCQSSVQVDVKKTPTAVTFKQYDTVCPGANSIDTIELTSSIIGSGGTFYIQKYPNGAWFTQSSNDNYQINNPVTSSSLGRYRYVAVSTEGCASDTSDFYHAVYDSVDANFEIVLYEGCKQDTVNFANTSFGDTLLWWDFDDGVKTAVTSASIAFPPFNDTMTHIYTPPTQPQDYFVTLVASNAHCADTITKQVTINHPLKAQFTADRDSICDSATVNFENTSFGKPGTVPTYQWYFGDGGTDTTYDTKHFYDSSGVYTVRMIITNYIGRDTAGCRDTADTVIVVDSLGGLTFTASDTVLCVGESIRVEGVFSPQGLLSTSFDFGDGTVLPDSLRVTHGYDIAGSYNVTFSGDYRICPSQSFTRTILVNPYPKVDLGHDSVLCLRGEAIALTDSINIGNPDAKWLWNTPTKDKSPTYYVRHPGVYGVTVELNGCSASDSVEVRKNCYLNIPNVFTPNNDGSNDYFLPRQLLSSNVTRFDMKVFNRWGEIVFETNALDGRGWDGKVNDKDQPVGVYIYLIEVSFGNNATERYQGNVTLLR